MWGFIREAVGRILGVPTMSPGSLKKLELPLVVVLGSTGTGKSKLAVELARQFNGEVVSADSMQVYQGLDILTNKVKTEEMLGIPHHMMSIVDHHTKFDVYKFQNMALPIVESIRGKNKIPIIVGGTNYYIESLLWEVLIDRQCNQQSSSPSSPALDVKRIKLDPKIETLSQSNSILSTFFTHGGNVEESQLLGFSNAELRQSLELIDPLRAQKVHPNDRRKTIRSLQVYFQTGRAHSDFIVQQAKQSEQSEIGDTSVVNASNTTKSGGMSHLGGPLRFRDVICLWIKVPADKLNERIRSRVEKMIERGLRRELEEHKEFLGDEACLSYTKGLLQSIGFKEFDEYLLLPVEQRYSPAGDHLFSQGTEKLKIITNQYAKKQERWIRQRFLCPSRRQVPPVYSLDASATDDQSWELNVCSPAFSIVKAHIDQDLSASILKELIVPTREDPEDDLIIRTCTVCERAFQGRRQYDEHLKSFRHKKTLSKKQTTKPGDDQKLQEAICEAKDLTSVEDVQERSPVPNSSEHSAARAVC